MILIQNIILNPSAIFPPVFAHIPPGLGINGSCGMVNVLYIKAPNKKQTALMMKAASTPYAETTNPPKLAPKHSAALQVALLNAFAVNSSLSSVIFGMDALSAGMKTAWSIINSDEMK